MKIAILGAGAFGTALGGILADKGYDIDYYDSKVEKEALSKVLLDSKYIILAVPSLAAPYLLPHLPKEKPLIIATKGFLDTHNFKDFADFMVLSGPGFADDIKAKKETYLTATDKRVIDLFATDYLTFDFTDDKNGVLMCGALKNVYAIYAGYLNLIPGSIQHEKYLTEAAEEMQALLRANGADPTTVSLACGLGDLRLTCNFPSRNYEFGQILRENSKATPQKTVEGLTALFKIKRGEIKVPDTALRLRELMILSNDWRV
jgi:glycerol-3-phosphate dehydrogenase (NAD(P)+)